MMYSSEDMCQDMTSEFAEKLSDLKGHGFSRALEFVQFCSRRASEAGDIPVAHSARSCE